MNKHERVNTEPSPADFFTGISLVVDQIEDDMNIDLPDVVLRVASAYRARDKVELKLAFESLSQHLAGMKHVADVAARQCVENLNRKPRV